MAYELLMSFLKNNNTKRMILLLFIKDSNANYVEPVKSILNSRQLP